MPSHECAAVDCGRKVGKPFLMCRDHWYMVPVGLRRSVQRLWDEGHWGTMPYRIAVVLAVREVGLREETIVIHEPERVARLGEWRDARFRLQRELGGAYAPEVASYVERLKKLMEECGGTCPLETCDLAIRIEREDAATVTPEMEARNARRVAAALDLYEGR